MIRLSLLLPCYNVEKYIQSCLDSIYKIDLPLEEFEVLCFDDCSPDNTTDIIRENMKKYSNLHIYRAKENVGLGAGRNALLKEAKGKYVWFIDPDDIVVSESVVPLLLQIEINDLDVLLFNFIEIAEDKSIIGTGSGFQSTDIMEGLSFAESVFGHNMIVYHIGYAWRFMVRRDYLKQGRLSFPEKMVWEDTVWMPKLILNAHRIQASHLVGYRYWHHDKSVCGTFEKSYPAKSIYTRCVTICQQLLDFSEELEHQKNIDKRYSSYSVLFWEFAQSHYLNKLPLYLSRTNRHERKGFYCIVRGSNVPQQVKKLANRLTGVLLHPRLGYPISNILSLSYKLKHYNSSIKNEHQ